MDDQAYVQWLREWRPCRRRCWQ